MKEKWQEFCEKTGVFLSPILFFISLLAMDMSFRATHLEMGTTSFFGLVPTAFSLAWCLLFTAVVFVLWGKAKKIVMSVLIGFFFLYLLANCVVYNVGGSVISFSDLAFAEDAGSFMSYQYFAFSWKIYVSLFASLFVGILSVLLADTRRFRWPVYAVCGVVFAFSVTVIAVVHYNNLVGTKKNFRWRRNYQWLYQWKWNAACKNDKRIR